MLREACDVAIYAGDDDQAASLASRAGDLPAETETDRFVATALTALAAAQAGDHARGAVLSASALELAERLDDPSCLIWAALTAAREGIWGDGLAHATRAVRIARERSLLSILPYALQVQSAQLIGRSQFDVAYSTAEEGHRLALDFGQPWAASWNLADLARSTPCAGRSSKLMRTPRNCERASQGVAQHSSTATSGARLDC